MDDRKIVELYWQRSESAIDHTQRKYGRYCNKIAYNILKNHHDAEECVNDTYVDAWNSMPPHKPNSLSAFLGKITRRISLDRWRRRNAEKRGGDDMTVAFDELAECIADESEWERASRETLALAISEFLEGLKEDERNIFIRRYWYFDTVEDISRVYGFSESKVKMSLMRTREKLAAHLEKEGIKV